MEMDDFRKIHAGTSDVRKRQGGGTVPASPRSCAERESCDGPSRVLPASTREERVIVDEDPRRRVAKKMVNRVDEVEKELQDYRRKKHRGFSDSMKYCCQKTAQMENEVFREIVEDYDDNPDLGNLETPIERLRIPTEKEQELIAWTLVKDARNIMEDPGAFVYEQIEELAKALTNFQGFREQDVSLATRCAFKLMTAFNKLDAELERWKKRYTDITEGKDTQEGKELIDREVQCQLSTEERMETEPDNSEGSYNIGNTNKEEFENKMEELLRKVIKDTGDSQEKDKEELPSKSYWEIPRSNVVLEKRDKKKEGKKKGTSIGETGKKKKEKPKEKPQSQSEEEEKDKSKEESSRKKRKRGAGVILELKGGGPMDYAAALKKCEKEIPLKEIGIPPLEVKKTRGGALLMEIRGTEEDHDKAERLVGQMKKVLIDEPGAKVWHPAGRSRVRLTGLPLGATAVEVATFVANYGGGKPGEVKVGPVRTNGSGKGVTWADCPADVASKVLRAAGATGLTMGWARVGVSLVERGPPQCFRCLARGHLGRWCPSVVDRGHCCLRCGRGGHRIGQCRAEKPRCPICEERGLRAEHRPGDLSQCRVVPPGPLRSPPPDPGEGTSGEEKRRSDPSVQGDKSLDRGVTAHAPRPSKGEDRGDLDRAEGGKSRAGSPDPWADVLETSRAVDGACRLGTEGSTSPSTDMQVEWEEGPERGVKRKGPTTRPCSVVMAPPPAPKKGVGGGVKQRKK